MTKKPQELAKSINISIDRISFINNITIQINLKENKILITTDKNFQNAIPIQPNTISQLVNNPDISGLVSSVDKSNMN